ncbi:uncharacterized protein LOC106715297 [Papilio machaon]|uniref:uncharacterized protein LOC106715297 n=1 Tax=Papilio machaon TaxID=76193 RepID=UPI001E665514|nr:uncharacterized protein LOC106715297 [Papilio machaon]
MSKLSFRARALDASKPMPIYLAEELPDLPDYSAINRAVPQMPSGMEKEEESEHHLQRAISGTGLIIPTPEVCEVSDLEFYERCYPADYKMPKQHIHMQLLWEEQEAPEYDIDSEDERWLKQQRHPELTELKFEQMMDKLERSSGQTVVTLNEAKLLLERHDDLVIAVYDYWLNKRLNTQHPLILSVKTEHRPGQSSNNPYLAFRRRTEKMQTRKNRKNDESSYEKMLKLRRELARALTLLEMVSRRERTKRELVRLTALLAERRYAAGDFTAQLPEPARQYNTVPISTLSFRREAYAVQHYPPRAPPTPVDQPRQREKRPYKRRKHRHHAAGSTQGLRDSGVCTSSDEEASVSAPSGASPRADTFDDGPFAFRRKPGCYYEMPTSTLCGDPVDPDSPSKEGLFEHELDERHRFTLTSVTQPYTRCVGFARRRVGRGGRVLLDRIATPLDDLWPALPFAFPSSSEHRKLRDEEVELETKAHRTPKEMTRDYHTGGKYPWRYAFRRHLKRNPDLWTVDLKPDADVKMDADVKPDKVKQEPMDVDEPLPDSTLPQDVTSDISVSARTIESAVRENLQRVMRKRSWSGCSHDSYDSDESLQPVEKEFEQFINEVNKKWLHFRPKTPPPSPPHDSKMPDDQFPLTTDTPFSVELRLAEDPPSGVLDPFITSEFTLGDLFTEPLKPDVDRSGNGLEGEDLLGDNFTGLTEAQVESILSETGLKAIEDVELSKDDKKIAISDDLLDELVKDVDKDPFLLQGQSSDGRAGSGPRRKRAEERFGSSVVHISAGKEPIYADKPEPPAPRTPPPTETPKEVKAPAQPVPTSKIIVEEVNEVPHIKVERKKKEDTIEEIQLAPGVQLKTVQTKHSPLKKHIITSAAHRRSADVVVTSQDSNQPQIVTVAVSDSLKVRLASQAAAVSGAGGGAVVGLIQNGPFTALALPVSQRDVVTASVGSVGTTSNVVNMATVGSVGSVGTVGSVSSATATRRVGAPLVQLAPAALAHKPLQLHPPPAVVVAPHVHHVPSSKLKVLHAHPLTHTQRAQLLQNRSLAQLPTVVSLAALGDGKPILKAAPGSVTQYFEIKSGQLGKGPHLVNVVRQPQPGKATVARLDINEARKRQVVFDGALKGNMTAATRPHRVSVSLDGRQIVRAALPVRAPSVRHQIQLKNRTVQVAAPLARPTEPATSITIAAPAHTSIPSSVVANLLHKNVQLPKGGQKIAISGPGGLTGNVQAIAFSTAQLKARQARLIAQPRPPPVAEIVEATTAPAASSSGMASGLSGSLPGALSGEAPLEGGGEAEDAATNGAVRRRAGDTLPMEVT